MHDEAAFDGRLLAAGLLVAMILSLEAGRRAGRRRLAREGEGARAGHGAVEAAVFGLFGLLLAFTFSGAAARFDTRRLQIVEEANAIGTAYLRLDLLPAEDQPALRQLFRQYVDSRLAAYARLPDLAAALAELGRGQELQTRIWNGALQACGRESAQPQATLLLVPALNEMFDISTSRTAAGFYHAPALVFVLLFALSAACAFLVGDAMAPAETRHWPQILAFTLVTVAAVYVIIDLEYPRRGLIRLTAYDQVLVDLRAGMGN